MYYCPHKATLRLCDDITVRKEILNMFKADLKWNSANFRTLQGRMDFINSLKVRKL